MRISPIRTIPVTEQGDITSFIDSYVSTVEERSVLVITSKIVSILEGRTVSKTVDKKTLIKSEADFYIEESLWEKYHLLITRKADIMIANAGIDESNANGKYILWPSDPFLTAKHVWNHLKSKFHLKNVGVVITDSRLTPLRWGTLGIGLAWCGFNPLNDYRGTPDIFGEPLKVTQSSVLDGLAAGAVLCMGEGEEQTPLAYVTEIPFVQFLDHAPSQEERNKLRIDVEDDIYSPLLVSPKWKKRRE